MKKTAILLTVFNRKNITLQGLKHLYSAIKNVPSMFFDIFLLDDNSTDGTADAVSKEFPNIHIIKGDGNLFWSGGMRIAWDAALKTDNYDYFIWFNDDAMIYPNALNTLFEADLYYKGNAIITGAFKDENGFVSYGGRNKSEQIVTPNGKFQEIYLMNGNLVLIPQNIVNRIGIIDSIFKHSLGDWDYGCRAIKAGFKVILTKEYIGLTNRHDMCIADPFLGKYSLKQRLKKLYSPKHHPKLSWIFNIRHMGIKKTLRTLFIEHLYVFFPSAAIIVRKIQHRT